MGIILIWSLEQLQVIYNNNNNNVVDYAYLHLGLLDC